MERVVDALYSRDFKASKSKDGALKNKIIGWVAIDFC